MFRYRHFLIFFLLSCSCLVDIQESESMVVKPLIWSGEDAPEGKWPFMAEIRTNDSSVKSKKGHICGAAVLNDDTIITAAHCMKDDIKPTNVFLYLGEIKVDSVKQNSMYEVSKFILYPSTDDHYFEDLGLIKLRRKINFTNGRIRKVCLPGPDTVPDGSKCVALGWGLTEPGKHPDNLPVVLQQVNIPIVPCKGDYPHVICAGFDNKPDGICNGDSGGPLLCPTKDNPNTYLLFGLSCLLFADCGKAPAGFTKVADYLDWIQKNAEA